MITNTIQSVEFLGMEISPVTLILIGTMILVGAALIVKLILGKGRNIKLFKGSEKFYTKHFMLIVFTTFFMLALLVKLENLSFEDPVMLVLTSLFILLFVGWTIMTDLRMVKVLFIAILGSFIGHMIALMI